MRNQGTPKTLSKAIENGVADAPGLILISVDEESIMRIKLHVMDFINQKVGILMHSDDPAEIAAAKKLYQMITAAE